MSRIIKFVLTLALIAVCMPLVVASWTEISKYLGLTLVPVPVVGTGSMYPSLFWEQAEGGPDDPAQRVVDEYRTTPRMYRRFPGFTIAGRTYLRRQIGFGDMVTFRSAHTQEILRQEGKDPNSGFIKRVIGLPGDRLELRDGYLIRNGEVLEEPYIYRPRSTYGDAGLSDCQVLTVLPDSYFVLGDNRKTSADSRGELGVIADQDISYVLPYADQDVYHSLYRDTARDQELMGTPTLDTDEFYRLVNETRTEAGLPELSPHKTLSISANYRAASILDGQELDLEASLARAGYHNVVTGELSIRGRFTAQELLTNILYFDNTKQQLLDSRFDDIAAADLNQEVDACPSEVVVVHLGGYVPADYTAETIDSWRSLAANLAMVIPSWETAQSYPGIDQAKLQELLTIFRRRLALAQEVIGVMERREWLSKGQQDRIQADAGDASRAKQLSEELNQL